MRNDANDCPVEKQSVEDGTRSKINRRNILLAGTALAATSALETSVETAQGQPAPSGQRPNILIIMGDDIGIPQISAYTMGMMGYRTLKLTDGPLRTRNG